MNTHEHWERIYSTKAPEQVSWFRPHLETSLALIERIAPNRPAALIDVGGGASILVDDLIARGYRDLTILDISEAAIEIAKMRLGEAARTIRWLCADVTQPVFAMHAYDVWHDRAVFHFLTDPADRASYVRNVMSAVKPGGHIIISTFGPEGPTKSPVAASMWCVTTQSLSTMSSEDVSGLWKARRNCIRRRSGPPSSSFIVIARWNLNSFQRR